MTVFSPSYSSMDWMTVSNEVSSSARRSSSLQLISLSIRELMMLGRRLFMAAPATLDRDARALASNAEMGGVIRVGIRFGRIMFERVVSVRRVRRAERAFSASSSDRRRFSRKGRTWSTALFPRICCKESNASAAASLTSSSESVMAVRTTEMRVFS